MILTAIFRGNILCMKKEAILLPLPVIKEGFLPSFLKHSLTTSSGSCTPGAKGLAFAGAELT
jgi:hypothetical protein